MGMSAAQIKIGKDYAINAATKDGRQIEVRFRVTEQVTKKSSDKTVNTFNGYRFDDNKPEPGYVDGSRPTLMEGVTVASFIDEFEKHADLVEKMRVNKEAKDAILAAKQAKLHKATKLLNDAMGLDPIDFEKMEAEYRYASDLPVKCKYNAIEIKADEELIDRLIAYLEKA